MLCHEIAHVQARHFAKRMEKATVVNIATLAGALLAILAGGGKAGGAILSGAMATSASFMLSYSRADEEEADRLGLMYMEEGKFDTSAMVTVFQKMLKDRWASPGGFPAYLATHPGLDQRIFYLEDAFSAHGNSSSPVDRNEKYLKFEEMKVKLIALYDDFTEGRKKLEELVEKNPGHSMPHFGLGLLYLRMNQYGEARESFRRALEINPAKGKFLRGVGVASYYSGDIRDAKSALSQAIILEPEDAEAYFYLGRIYAQEGMWEMALANLEKAKERNENLEDLFHHMALAYSKLGNLGEAHFMFGIHSEKQGNVKNAKFHFKKALTFEEGNSVKIAAIKKHMDKLDDDRRDKTPDEDPQKISNKR